MRHLVIEADGGSRGNPGPAAYGAVVLDADTGEILVELADYLGEQTNNVAEYEGVTAGLAAAREIDPEAMIEARGSVYLADLLRIIDEESVQLVMPRSS